MKKALIQCGDHFENQTRILPLALHLKKISIEPVILLYSYNSSKIFDYHEITTVYLDEYRGLVGKNSKSFPYDYEKIFYIERARAYSRFSTNQKIANEKKKIDRDYNALLHILNEISPELMFIWNGFTGNVANVLRVICEASGDFYTWYMERSFFNDSLFVDSKGVNAAASTATYFGYEYTDSIPAKYISGKTVNPASEISDAKLFDQSFVFLPLQVQTDTNNILYSPYIKKMRSLVLAVVDAVEKINNKLNKDIKVVVRHHPEEIEKNLNLPRHPLIYFRSDGAIKDWCSQALAVVNINSTVGLEAIFLEKPVFSFGKSLYSHNRLTYVVSPDGFQSQLETIVGGNGYDFDRSDIEAYFKYLYFYNTCNLDNLATCVVEKFGDDIDNAGTVDDPDLNLKNYLADKSSVQIGCFLSPSTKLNLTYRTNAVVPSPDLYRKIFQNKYHYDKEVEFQIIGEGDCYSEFDIIIRGPSYAHIDLPDGILVLDEYLLDTGGLK